MQLKITDRFCTVCKFSSYWLSEISQFAKIKFYLEPQKTKIGLPFMMDIRQFVSIYGVSNLT
jgi:hypothetical protein